MTTAKALRAVLYARYSSELQSDLSLENQLSLCQAHAESRGYRVVGEYTDRAMSSMARDRPGLHALLQAADAHAIDVVVVENIDRISRDPGYLHDLFDRLTYNRVLIDSQKDGLATALTIGVRGLTGSIFNADLSRRVRLRMREQAKTGKLLTKPPYGYRKVPGKPDFEIDPDKAKVVRRVFKEYIAGRTPQAIARTLNDEGVPAPGRTPWAAQNVLHAGSTEQKGIIGNPIYVGRTRFGLRQNARHPLTKRINPVFSDEAPVEIAVPHLRIIDDATWEAAHAVRAKRSRALGHAWPKGRPQPTAPRSERLLSGLMVCGVCGGAMNLSGGSGRNYGPRILCWNARNHQGCTHSRTYTYKTLERAILTRLAEALGDEAMIKKTLAHYNANRAKAQKRAKGEEHTIRRRLAEIDAALTELVSLVAVGGKAAELVRAKLEALDGERAGLEERLKLAESEAKGVALDASVIARYRALVARLQDELGQPGRKPKLEQAFRSLVDSVTLYPTKAWSGEIDFAITGKIGAFLGFEPEPESRTADEIVCAKRYNGFPKDMLAHTGRIALGRFVSRAA